MMHSGGFTYTLLPTVIFGSMVMKAVPSFYIDFQWDFRSLLKPREVTCHQKHHWKQLTYGSYLPPC